MNQTDVPEARKKFFAGLTDEKNRLTPSAARYAIWLGLPVFADYERQPGQPATRPVLTITQTKPRQITLDAGALTVSKRADEIALLWTPPHKEPTR